MPRELVGGRPLVGKVKAQQDSVRRSDGVAHAGRLDNEGSTPV